MDISFYQTDERSLRLDTAEKFNTTSLPPVNFLSGLDWSTAIRISVLSLLMLITLLGNVIVIITIVSCAELRKKRVNLFILNLAVGDLIVCFVAMPTYIVMGANSGQWKLGAVACKLTAYAFMVSVAFTTFLLAAMSIDRYQVKLVSNLAVAVVVYFRKLL